ncbi:NADP-dependent malic enzyme [Anaplasmataceae bacterium AB001_6]|nr:NADP-dependent malic enzyme [Anaplasmataceae bacterium AB001_6]
MDDLPISKKEALDFHKRDNKSGKLAIELTKPLVTQRDLALAYSPGVAYPCLEIKENPDKSYDYTSKGNMVAVISNGTAVLGLGNLGAMASKPVMEGKSALLKRFADIDSIDIEVDEEDPKKLIETIERIACTFGGINLEDISSPSCFEVEQTLAKKLSVPIFHDDQHGTAIITSAALLNYCDIVGKKIEDLKIVFNGCGAAGVSCINLSMMIGAKKENILVCDQSGVIHNKRENLSDIKKKYSVDTDRRTLTDALKGADVFIGLSVKDALKPEMILDMLENPAIFAMANPDPEISPEVVYKVRPDAIVATGRSDYVNQVNNVMCFPYIFRGALDVRSTKINDEMKLAAVSAIAELARQPVPEEVYSAYSGRKIEYGKNYIIPTPFDPRLVIEVSAAVAKAAVKSGVSLKYNSDNWNEQEYKHKLRSKFSSAPNIINMLSDKLKSNKRRIIFAEGEEKKVIRTALQWVGNGYGVPILVGREERVHQNMEELGVYHFLKDKVIIANSAKSDKIEEYTNFVYSKVQRKGYLYRNCLHDVKTDRNIFATCMLSCGDGDALVTGLTRSYYKSVNEVAMVLGEDYNKTFATSIVFSGSKSILIADTAIDHHPDPEKLAYMTVQVAKRSKFFGSKPRVAFISDSNFGSGCKDNYNVSEALKILDASNVDFEYDGEMSVDVALNYEKLSMYPFCKLTDTANILIMPGSESASALCAFVKEFSKGTVIGPMIMGLENNAIQVISMKSSVSEILNASIIAATDQDIK